MKCAVYFFLSALKYRTLCYHTITLVAYTNLLIRDRNNGELNIELNRYYDAFKLNSGDHMIVLCTIHAECLHSNDGYRSCQLRGRL